MSRIATAFAISQGRMLDLPADIAAPDVTLPESTASSAAPRISRRLLSIIIAGSVCAFVLVGLLLWLLLRNEEPDPHTWVSRATHRAAVKVKALAHVKPVAAPAPVVAAPVPLSPIASEEVSRMVQQLAISAVTSGSAPKAFIAGKVYYPGDLVAPGLYLHEIADSVLLFRDDAGSLYPRRF